MSDLVKFKEGNIYEMRFVTDSDLKVPYICVKRTEKTIYLERFKEPSDKLTRRVKTYNGEEFVVAGSYSMAPSIYASRVIG